MRPSRISLRVAAGSPVRVTCAALMLSLCAACGGNAAAPAATPAPTGAAAVVPAPSPQRPALASPNPSPSVGTASAPSATAGSSEAAAGDSYDIQSGDTLATIAQQFYGDPAQWRRIYDANKDTIGSDPDKLKLGTTIKVPPKQP